jgi:ubiquinone/menaquinone biosynthesis C-methylase UbiE
MFFVLPVLSMAQDPWKNIYSQPAWEERDTWQKANELIALLGIRDGSRVADVGSHEGYMTFKLARKVGNGGVVYSVDLDQSKLDKLKRRADENRIQQIRPIKGEEDNPRLPANTLDAVLILDTYHEMDYHNQILQHIMKSLIPGGRLLICEPIADARRALERSEQERKHEIAMRFVLDDLKKAGFKITFTKDNFIDRTKQKGDRMWVVVAEKVSNEDLK